MPAPEREEVTMLPRNPPIAGGLEKIVSCFGELHTPGVGGLAQAWMPTHVRRQAENLETKGMPYAILGPGDMLPCFRALCCKYSFTTDLRELHLMGAPGRVYMSGQAETSDNVQQCSQRIYPVLSEAKACSVSATVVLPIFADAQRAKAVAVLELFQFNGPGFGYKTVFDWANRHLGAAGLFTAGMETQAFEMQSHALSFNFFCKQSSVLSSLDFMFSSKANSTGHSSVAPAKKCQKMHHTGSDAQGLEASQRQLGSISSKILPTEQNESSPELSTLGRAFLSQHYSGVSPEAVHGTTQQQPPQVQDSVVSQPATAAEEPPPPDISAYSAPEAAAVSAEQQQAQSFSQDATADEQEELQRFESQEMLPADWGDPTAYRFVSQEMVPSPGPCSGESAEPFGYLGPHWGKLGAEASHALNNLQSKQVVPVSGIFNDLYPMAPHKRKVDRMTAEPKEPVLALGRRHSSTTRLESDADDAEELRTGRKDTGSSLQPGEVHNKKTLTREVLEAHFGGTLAEAAAALGVCSTTLKRACRRHGIAAWPRKTRYLSRQTQEATRPLPQPATATDAGRDGFAAARMNFCAARSHDAAFAPVSAAGVVLPNEVGSGTCNSEQQASMTTVPENRDLPFPPPVQGRELSVDSQQLEPSYAEHASFIPDRDAGAEALFPEAHIMAEPRNPSEGSAPRSAGAGPGYPPAKSLKASVDELDTLFLGCSGLDTNWHPPDFAAVSSAKLEVRASGACNSEAIPATDSFPEIPEAWLESAFLCN